LGKAVHSPTSLEANDHPYDDGTFPATTENREFTMTAPNVVAHVLKTLPAAASATFLALFPIVNPFGGVPLFFSLSSSFSAGERNRTALKTGIYVTVILIFFMFLGRFVLSFFGISLPVLKIAGGLIVANTAWGMVTASSRITAAESHEASTKEDISLTPMAVPILSGPGSIGVVMGLAADADSKVAYLGMVIAIAAIGLAVYLFLRLGGPLVERLGPCATGAINRIFGFLILAIAVQLLWDGVADFK
jgi:multiple antibiotic resistance protein